MVRIAGFHPVDPGSSPGNGIALRSTSMVGRVVKAADLRSAGQSPRGFEPHTMQNYFYLYVLPCPCSATGQRVRLLI